MYALFAPLGTINLILLGVPLKRSENLGPSWRIIPFKYNASQVSTPVKDSHSKARYRSGDVDTR